MRTSTSACSHRLPLLDRVLLPVTAHGNFHVYNQYTVRVRQRDELRNFLKEKGHRIQEVCNPLPCICRIATTISATTKDRFPSRNARPKKCCRSPLCWLTEEQRPYVVQMISEFYRRG